jgi:hypothetical protein
MDDINKCRCCLSIVENESSLLKMTETFLFDNKPHKNCLISEIYFIFCGIINNDNIIERKSLKICIKCMALLQNSFTFRELCRQSHETLNLQSQIKEGILIFMRLVQEPLSKIIYSTPFRTQRCNR